jgi:hypothetical protein
MGAVNGYVFTELVAARRGLEPIDREAYVREYVKILWAGMTPEAASASNGRAAAKPARQRAVAGRRAPAQIA